MQLFQLFPALCIHSTLRSAVQTMARCLSVCLSVTSWCSVEEADWINLVFDTRATHLVHLPLCDKEIRVSPKIKRRYLSLRWYGHVLQKEDDWVKKCMEYKAEGPRSRGRPKRTYREVMEEDCQTRKFNKEDAMDRSRWREKVHKGCLMTRMGVIDGFKHQRQRAQATYMPVKSSTVMHVKQ